MNDPVSRAKWVLESKGISGIPAISLTDIAKSECIPFKINDYPNDVWDGILLFNGTKRAILINTRWGNVGKSNFTFAHELGHYFLDHKPNFNQNGQPIIRCTSADIKDEQKPREVEANRFAVELLMPESQFQLDMAGAPIDFDLIDSLSKQYMVSKRACSNRILGLTHSPCIIIITEGTQVTSITASRAARSVLKRMATIPANTAAHTAITSQQWQDEFTPCESEKWLVRPIPGSKIFECTHIQREGGRAMTILKW